MPPSDANQSAKVRQKADEKLRPDELVIELDGVEPSDITAPLAVEYLRSMLRLVTAVSNNPLELRGMRIVNKCTAFAIGAADVPATQLATEEALRVLRAGHVEAGLGSIVTDARRAVANLPASWIPKLRIGTLSTEVERRRAPSATLPMSLEVLRVVPLRVGGSTAAVRFHPVLEDRDFTLGATPTMARRLGAYLYLEVDIHAEIIRSLDGAVETGRVVDFDATSDIGDISQWEAWYRKNASAWDDVEDVEQELDRD
jgi:hypothetical protein